MSVSWLGAINGFNILKMCINETGIYLMIASLSLLNL